MNIFVANLNFRLQNEFLREVFEEYGEVESSKIILDRATGKSKGYGFVEMPNENEALHAIQELDGYEIDGKTIVVKKANSKEPENKYFASRERY